MSFTPEEARRYSRHFVLPEVGEEGQTKLKQAKVLIIGVGGLGSPASSYLAASGIGLLGLVDGDSIDASNLARQLLHCPNEGQIKKKAESARASLTQINPHIEIQIYDQFLDQELGEEIFPLYDIILDCTDNPQTRYLINDLALKANRPVVYGSIYKFDGQVSLWNYQGGPCLRCAYPDEQSFIKLKESHTNGVMGFTPGIIGSMQAQEVTKVILGIGDNLSGKILHFNGMENDINIFKIKKREGCICTNP